MNKRFCPSCGAETVEGRGFCGDCGCPIRTGGWETVPPIRTGAPVVVEGPQWNRTVAVILSLFIPGLGHLYRGKFLAAAGWFVVTFIGYVLFCPGFVLHAVCVMSAASGNIYEE